MEQIWTVCLIESPIESDIIDIFTLIYKKNSKISDADEVIRREKQLCPFWEHKFLYLTAYEDLCTIGFFANATRVSGGDTLPISKNTSDAPLESVGRLQQPGRHLLSIPDSSRNDCVTEYDNQGATIDDETTKQMLASSLMTLQDQ